MTDRAAARANLVNAVRRIVDALEVKTLAAFDRKRIEHERKMTAIMARRFKVQAAKVQAAMEAWYPGRKSDPQQPSLFDQLDLTDDETEADLILELIDAAGDGIDVFKAQVATGIDYTQVNTRAAKWAQQHAGDLIGATRATDGTLRYAQVDKTTLDAVRQAVSSFVSTPGMTIGDVMRMIQDDSMSDMRAHRIATTEITNAYGVSAQLSGEELKKEFPDVRVIKIWSTDNDDKVCPICEPLDGMEVDIDEPFGQDANGDDIMHPGAHIFCRCAMLVTTKI